MILGSKRLATTYRGMITPFKSKYRLEGLSGGLGPAGYDIALSLRQSKEWRVTLHPRAFILAYTMERFDMPIDVMGIVHDKSTLARQGIALQNTVIEPGWRGYLTLEITNHSHDDVILVHKQPIAQVVFHQVEGAEAYDGIYQDQEARPQSARLG